MGYHYRRPARRGPNPRLETALAVLVLLILVAAAIVFLFVYHDFPLRTS
jgi:hypothetical protein